jgi:hypothetical protein
MTCCLSTSLYSLTCQLASIMSATYTFPSRNYRRTDIFASRYRISALFVNAGQVYNITSTADLLQFALARLPYHLWIILATGRLHSHILPPSSSPTTNLLCSLQGSRPTLTHIWPLYNLLGARSRHCISIGRFWDSSSMGKSLSQAALPFWGSPFRFRTYYGQRTPTPRL